MTADTCLTCPEKDDQIAALVEALEALLEAGPEFGRCVCGRKFFQEHRRGCAWIKALHVHADIPAAARERAEERERLRTAAFKAQDKWEQWVESELAGTSLYRRVMRVAKANRAALAGEKANR